MWHFDLIYTTEACYPSTELPRDEGTGGGPDSSLPSVGGPPNSNSPSTPNSPPPNSPSSSGSPRGSSAVTTSPNDPDNRTEPCKDVKKNTFNNAANKNAISSLRNSGNLDLDYEKGLLMDQNSPEPTNIDGPPNYGGMDIQISSAGTAYGIAHVHYNGPNMMPAFSFEDLETLYKIYKARKDNNKPVKEIFFTVYTRAGQFAMQIEDFSFFEQQGANFQNNDLTSLRKEFHKNIYSLDAPFDNDNVTQISASLAKFGVGLYKASNSSLASWSKVTDRIDPITNLPSLIPCN
ncbi:MAG: hypothetical protein CFE24_03930 [Flavobacterium sp. BFFFF2]|nr:MAG: hypothetical protein CFE24_03930 [Flavobacterium sp. BFFFF2]